MNCKHCNGNDKDMPCAYPSEGKPGCLRDSRLADTRRIAFEKLSEAEKAWCEYYLLCEPGQDRNSAAQVCENIRKALRPLETK